MVFFLQSDGLQERGTLRGHRGQQEMSPVPLRPLPRRRDEPERGPRRRREEGAIQEDAEEEDVAARGGQDVGADQGGVSAEHRVHRRILESRLKLCYTGWSIWSDSWVGLTLI